jgi:hypothetical protein
MSNGPKESAVYWIPDDAALNRIITAVGGTRHGQVSKSALNVDRNRLVSDLIDAHTKWHLFKVLDSNSGARNRADLFSTLADAAKHFKIRLLDETGEKYVTRAILSRAFDAPNDFDVFIMALNRIIKCAEDLKISNSQGGWVRLRRPPREWFAGEVLPPIYTHNFGRKEGTSRKDSSKPQAGVGGPYIRFVLAVTKEMRITISAETIARAIKDIRAGRDRRTARQTTVPRPPGW